LKVFTRDSGATLTDKNNYETVRRSPSARFCIRLGLFVRFSDGQFALNAAVNFSYILRTEGWGKRRNFMGDLEPATGKILNLRARRGMHCSGSCDNYTLHAASCDNFKSVANSGSGVGESRPLPSMGIWLPPYSQNTWNSKVCVKFKATLSIKRSKLFSLAELVAKTVVTCAIYCMQLLHAIYCMQ